MARHERYTLSENELLDQLETSSEGLKTSTAQERLKQHGLNKLPGPKRMTLVQIILRQFTNPLIYVLIVAGAVSLVLQEFEDAIFIGIILFINALIGAAQEWKAESSAEALQQMMKVRATVRRDGRNTDIDAEQLVPGDVVLLESGDMVPADLRLLEVNNLTAEEAVLTGESVAVEKDAGARVEANASAGDRLNMAFAGTMIATGRARGVVVATALQTEIGLIAEELTEVGISKAPLVARMEKFAHMVSLVVLSACLILGTLGYFSGIPLEEIFFFAVAIAVSAIPEGLPIAMTVALSIGTSRMAKRNVIVRKLTAVEGLGSCTMIATDKTGTLTVDQQTVQRIVLRDGTTFTLTGQGYNGEGAVLTQEDQTVQWGENTDLDAFIANSVYCNDASLNQTDDGWTHQGDAVDAAILALAYKASTSPDAINDGVSREGAIPFESERKFAATYYRKDGQLYVAAKGAAEVILANSSGSDHQRLEKLADELASNGFRVLALGSAPVNDVNEDELPNLDFLGLYALIDPPREGVMESIDRCHTAGVEVCMITGDHPATALAIAQELHIAQDKNALLTGVELDALGDSTHEEFSAHIKDKRVFARVSPKQKQQIVAAFQNQGHYVAVTGDGVNDAPALKTSNIGVAMGYGTDVAKGVASIILTDNNFTSIAAGIEEGRNTYANLRKIIYLLVSTGAAELIMITLSLLAGTPLPFLPAQILWLNLVTNGIQDKGLAFEPGEPDSMRVPPRSPSERIFDQAMIRQTLIAACTMAFVSFALWYHLLNNEGKEAYEARNIILLLMVLLQNFHVFNSRSETSSVFSIPLWSNWWLIGGVLLAQLIHIISMQLPFMQNLLQISPVSYGDWGKLLATAALIVVVLETYKLILRKRAKSNAEG